MPSIHRPARLVAAGLFAAASCVALGVGGVALAGAAHAAFSEVPPTGQPGRLVLSSDPYPATFLDLSPGEPAHWSVGARIENAASATLALELRKSGELVQHPRGLVMTVDACDVAWSGLESTPSCANGAERITVATPADDYSGSSPTFALEPIAAGAPEFLLITLAIDDSPAARADESLMGLEGTMAVGLTATAIDGAPVPADGGLATTGMNWWALVSAAALAAGLLGIGGALRLARTGTDA